MPSSPIIRPFAESDALAVADIIDYFSLNTFASYASGKVGKAGVEQLFSLADEDPFWVVEVDATIVGSGGLKAIHGGDCVRRTGEVGYSFQPEYTGRVYGSLLLEHLEAEARTRGMDTLVASISSKNERSIAFHVTHGFVECGRFVRAGRKFDQDFDIVWMQKFI